MSRPVNSSTMITHRLNHECRSPEEKVMRLSAALRWCIRFTYAGSYEAAALGQRGLLAEQFLCAFVPSSESSTVWFYLVDIEVAQGVFLFLGLKKGRDSVHSL